ncbi:MULTISPECIES: hypothetical protein [Halorussus]|uniref:hypothetical protein n=1 Tax=Halorussus TaxID=1070314 RepID=UPI0020A001CC|nr:hypothetical protein [Halorussus vallis]USZ78649.1 hypothetical protein NGM07_25200 [Halorussus vallis]USZ78680.1 hypothetical protein NGM07_24530 [Halorussus vallis]
MSTFDKIQSQDDTSAAVAAENKVKKRIRDRLRRENREVEAEVRSIISKAEEALAGESEHIPEKLLGKLHWYLWLDPDRAEVLHPQNDDLARKYKRYFQRCHVDRERGIRPDPQEEYKILNEVAKALGYQSSVTDRSQYAPVRLESIDEPGAKSVENPTPIGRRRIGHDDPADPEDRAVEIPHQSCDHILAVALPRSGKDSTLASIGKNLWDEHGYSYFSILDDGRMETPMLAIPNDEKVIQQNLERFGQEPDAFDAEVFVPAMDGLPERLPQNFTRFSIGIDSLTPHLILRLAGVTKSDETVEARIKQALDDTLAGTGQVTELVARLQSYAKQMEATIEWTEIHERQSGKHETETYTANFQMDAEDALNTAAQRLGQLAGEGLVTSPDAVTNLDMQKVIARQEQAAVLCCNFLKQGQEALKYTIMDLWLRLIYQARDDNPRLPRVCLEIRELKNVAPSKLADVRYKDAIKTLQQTIFFISTQGGSRRILMLGSTQKLNDVYKPVRSNMATKILLRLGEEEIETLDRSYHFDYRQKDQLAEFSIGQGMILAGGEAYWPIDLRGAPCGLGLGDQHWFDRYGRAWGARVRQSLNDYWNTKHSDSEWWVHVPDAEVREMDDPPKIGDTYSEWYLLSEDFPDETEREDVDRALIRDVLENRREYPVKTDLSLAETGAGNRQRDLSIAPADPEDSGVDDLAEEFGVPQDVQPWLADRTRPGRQRMVEACRILQEHGPFQWYKDMDEFLSYPESTMRNYVEPEGLEPCFDTSGSKIKLTPVGEQVANIEWEVLEEKLRA